jgi:hypothetical protein
MQTMSHLSATLVVVFVILGAVAATLVGWRHRFRTPQDSTKASWRSAVATAGLVLLSFSVLWFAAYGARNALIGGDGNGSMTTLTFIRTGNYLSLFGVISSLAGKGKDRWPALVGSCFMLFLWFAEGMSL